MPGLKPIAGYKLLFKIPQSVVGCVADIVYV
jgi:hypothetical protein